MSLFFEPKTHTVFRQTHTACKFYSVVESSNNMNQGQKKVRGRGGNRGNAKLVSIRKDFDI